MIDVTLNTSTGRNILTMMIGLQAAVNQLNSKIITEQNVVKKAFDDIKNQKQFYDMRYKTSKQFFANPEQATTLPQGKKSQMAQLQTQTELLLKNKERITNYNANVQAIKSTALYKGLRRTI